MEQSTSSQLHLLEWDFSYVQDDELEACLIYELAREIRDPVAYYGNQRAFPSRELKTPLALEVLTNPAVRELLGILYPEKLWIAGQKLPEYLFTDRWADLDINLRMLAPRYTSDIPFGVLRIPLEEVLTFGKDEPAFQNRQTVSFSIDWTLTDDQLAELMVGFLERLRPQKYQRFSINLTRGRQSIKDGLNALSAMRLRHNYRADEATKITGGNFRKPLYSEPFAWDRAANRAVKLFKAQFPGAGEPKSAEKKKSPMGRPRKTDTAIP